MKEKALKHFVYVGVQNSVILTTSKRGFMVCIPCLNAIRNDHLDRFIQY
jgi:hypothetical protein